MKRLGAYISPRADTASSSPYFTKGCFVYFEYSPRFTNRQPRIDIWRLDANFNQRPDEVIFLKSPSELKEHIATCETWPNHCISYRDRTYRILDMKCRFTTFPDIEVIDELTVESINHYGGETWKHDGDSAYRFLKEAKLTEPVVKRPEFLTKNLVIPNTVGDVIKEELKKSLEKSVSNSIYGMGGFTTNPAWPTITVEEIGKMFDKKNKETKTMEKKMTETDLFLRNLNDITITSTYSKLDHRCGDHYIYYPEMEITEDMADTLLTVLLMAKREYISKVVFNPEKGTTTISKSVGDPVTVRCRDGEFDYILGYEMARTKMYLGTNDYNWFNKIKNHRKTHIQYTEKPNEPKAKRTSKKGGKK